MRPLPLSRPASRPIPPAANLHMTRACNAKCRYCYAHFYGQRDSLSTLDWVQVIQQLAEAGVEKVNFVGGEPTLVRGLPVMLVACRRAGLTTSIVSNGFRLRELLDNHEGLLDWVGISLDSPSDDTLERLGRGRVVEQSIELLDRARRQGARTKVNTVVTAMNWNEDMSAVFDRHLPDRWKVFRFLAVKGENDDALDLAPTDEQFAAFLERHRELQPIAEDNDDMRGSYLMVDPEGRLFDNVDGAYRRSEPLLKVGVEHALSQVAVSMEKMERRGGVYNWHREVETGAAPAWIAIEGLDGSGKSSVVRELALRMSAAVITNPPEELRSGRTAADLSCESDRRAWYREANRVAALRALEHLSRGVPVVMDRSAASTVAYAAATGGEDAALCWPSDIPRPDRVYFLHVEEPERLRRIGDRDRHTPEESRLGGDPAFRQRVINAYEALGVELVDASRPLAQVVDGISKRTRG